MRNNSLKGHTGKLRNIWLFTNRHASTSLLIISSQRRMTYPQSLVQSTPALDYEELLEEMEKLDIADLLLIYRRVASRWTHSMKRTDIRRLERLIILQCPNIMEIAASPEFEKEH